MEYLEPCELFELRQPTRGWTGHLAFVQSRRRPCREVVAAWVLDGLARDEKVVYVHEDDAYEDDEAGELLSLVGEHDPTAGSAVSDGRIEVVPLREVYRPGGSEQLVDRALAEGFPAVRVSADLSAAFELFGRPGVEEVERGLDELSHHRPLSALCRISETTCTTKPALLGGHVDGICACSLAIVAVAGGVRLSGEVDFVNEELFAAILSSLAPVGGRFQLDLEKLHFLSVGGARALVQATEAYRQHGGRVVLAKMSPVVRKVMEVCGYGELFELEASAAEDEVPTP
jgi:anti-anti-sigma factor